MPYHAETIAIAGTVLTCPKCRARIGTLTKTLYQNFSFGLDAIRFETGHRPRKDQAKCGVCEADYSQVEHNKDGQRMFVHTEYGWLPPTETKQ